MSLCPGVPDETGEMPDYHKAMPAHYHVVYPDNEKDLCYGCLGEFLNQCGNDQTKYPVTITYLEIL